MQENLAEANDARVVDLEAGIADGADGDRAGEALQQREVDVDVEPLRLEAGKAIGDRLERRANSVEMVEPLAQAEVAEVVGDDLVAQEGREFFVLLEEAALEDEVAAILDLGDGVEARQVDPGALLARELRPENQR